MIDEHRPVRPAVLQADPRPSTTGSSRLAGDGKGLRFGVLALAALLSLAVAILGTIAVRSGLDAAGREIAARRAAEASTAAIEAARRRDALATMARQDAARARAADAAASGSTDPADWITVDDYPAAALRANVQGIVTISWVVGASGRVTDCVVTTSSGSADLDRAACGAITLRARYPRAAEGEKPRIYSRRVVWKIPD